MGDLRNPKVIVAKGFLFLFAGLMAAGTLLILHPDVRAAALLAIAVFCFARFYYFAFYVLERYVDPGYKFAGLSSFVVYFLRKRPPAP